MNILVIDSTFLGRAPNREKTLSHIHHWLSKPGVKVWIYTTSFGREFYLKNLDIPVEFVRIPFSGDYDEIGLLSIPWEFLKRIAGALVARIPGEIEVTYSISSIIVDVLSALLLRARRKGLRTFCVFDNFVPPPSQRPGRFIYKAIPYAAHLMTRAVLGRMTGIFSALVDSNHAKLTAQFQGRCRIIHTPNGLDLDRIARAVPAAEKRYDLAYLGRMHPAKGVFDAIEAAARLKEWRKDVSLVMIGPEDAATKGPIAASIRSKGLEQNVTFSGFVSRDEKYSLLKASRVFLFLSYDESFPVSFMEAIACRLPVIAYDLDVYKDPPYRDSFHRIVAKGDAAAAAAHARALLEDPDRTRQEIERHYSTQKVIKSHSEVAELEFKAFLPPTHGHTHRGLADVAHFRETAGRNG